MSQTTIPISDATSADRAVRMATGATQLAAAAEANPAVKAELQTLFDSYSHNPVVTGLVSVVAVALAQRSITIDSTLLTVGIGLLVTAAGYAWQWVSMKLNKPVVGIAS